MAAVTGAEAPPVEDAGTGGADDTENGDKNVQEALAGKIAQLDAKKNEDKGTEKELSRMYKKASKELKEQLEAITSDSEKVKFLQQKYLDKVHHCNAADRKAENLQVSLGALGARPSPPRAAAGRRLSHPVSVCLSVCVCVYVCVCVRARAYALSALQRCWRPRATAPRRRRGGAGTVPAGSLAQHRAGWCRDVSAAGAAGKLLPEGSAEYAVAPACARHAASSNRLSRESSRL